MSEFCFSLKNRLLFSTQFSLEIEDELKVLFADSLLNLFGIENTGYIFKDFNSNRYIKLEHKYESLPIICIDITNETLNLFYYVNVEVSKYNKLKDYITKIKNKIKLVKFKNHSKSFLKSYAISENYKCVDIRFIEPEAVSNTLNGFISSMGYIMSSFKFEIQDDLKKFCLDLFLSYLLLGYNNKRIEIVKNASLLLEYTKHLDDENILNLLENEKKYNETSKTIRSLLNLIEIKDNKITDESIQLLKINYKI